MNKQTKKSPETGCTQSEGHIDNTMPRNHTPIYPAVDSLQGRLLARLLSYRVITWQIHLSECGSSSLADAVFKLRHTYHWPVDMVMHKVANRDKVNSTSQIGFYSLTAEVIAKAGIDGQSFIEQVMKFERDAQGRAA